MNLKSSWPVLKKTFSEFGEDNVLRLSAALAYYAMFSIGPLLVIAVGLAGLAFGHEAVHQQIQEQLRSLIGENSAQTVGSMMAAQKPSKSLATAIVGLVALLLGAGGVFGQMQDSLNTIWGVEAKPGMGIGHFLRQRFLSLTMVLGIGFLLLISMALTTFLTAVGGAMGSHLGVSEAFGHILDFVVSFGVISMLFAMIFKFLPDVKVPFRKVWVGAVGTALLFTGGKYVLAMYLGRESTSSAYGAAGSVIVLLMWVYYASVILLFGAEFTQVYARQTGAKIVPTKYAVAVTEEARAEQGMSGGERRQPANAGPEGAKRDERQKARAFASTKVSGPLSRRISTPQIVTPGMLARAEPLRFVGLMVVAGFAGGMLMQFKSLRKAVQIYFRLRRF